MQILKVWLVDKSIGGSEHPSQGGITFIKFFGDPCYKIVGEGFNRLIAAITIRVNFSFFFCSNTFHDANRESVLGFT